MSKELLQIKNIVRKLILSYGIDIFVQLFIFKVTYHLEAVSLGLAKLLLFYDFRSLLFLERPSLPLNCRNVPPFNLLFYFSLFKFSKIHRRVEGIA